MSRPTFPERVERELEKLLGLVPLERRHDVHRPEDLVEVVDAVHAPVDDQQQLVGRHFQALEPRQQGVEELGNVCHVVAGSPVDLAEDRDGLHRDHPESD